MDLIFTFFSMSRLLYLLLGTSISFILYFYTPSTEAYWLIWSALFLSLLPLSGGFFLRLNVITITGMITALVVFLSHYASLFSASLAAYICLLTMGLALLKERYRQYVLPILIINMLAIIASFLTFSSSSASYRPIFIILGTGVACLLQFIFYPIFKQAECRFDILVCLRFFRLLNKEFFLGLLQTSYTENVYLFERRMYVQKNNLMRAMERMQYCLANIKNKKNHPDQPILHFIKQLRLVYTLLINCSQIRWRINNHASFDICKQELLLLSQEMDKAFSFMMKRFSLPRFLLKKKNAFNLQELQQALHQLEENYQHVLQVAADDPLAFLLFLHGIKALVNESDQLYQYSIEVDL